MGSNRKKIWCYGQCCKKMDAMNDETARIIWATGWIPFAFFLIPLINTGVLRRVQIILLSIIVAWTVLAGIGFALIWLGWW